MFLFDGGPSTQAPAGSTAPILLFFGGSQSASDLGAGRRGGAQKE
jgi:hypothetical protein